MNVKGRTIEVSGPKGKITKTIPCEVTIKNDKKAAKVKVYRYFNDKAQKSMVKTSKTLIQNMIDGVTDEFTYTARAFYNHHPMRFAIKEGSLCVDNFLGARRSIKFAIPQGITWTPAELKDYYYISGKNKEQVGTFFSTLHTTLVATKFDRRRFNDGFYLIQKTRV